MYISLPILIVISIFGILYLIGMFIYAQQCEREWYEKYMELSERHKELWKEYNKLRHNAIFGNISYDD